MTWLWAVELDHGHTTHDHDLEAWLAGEAEQPCELWNRIPGEVVRYELCGRAADWIMHVTYPCGHHNTEARMVCDPCKRWLDSDGYDIGCGATTQALCGAVKAEIRWMERAR